MMPPDVLEFIQANAEEYRLCARIVGVTVSYPLDNRCTRCEHISRYALAPYPDGWLCRSCAYPCSWREADG